MFPAVEVDRIDETSWNVLTTRFSDANIYQTWPYEAVKSGESKLSHLVVRNGADVAAAAQARVVHLPFFRSGIAYVRWGPLSRRRDQHGELTSFQDAVRALKTEYVDRRGLSLRILPRVSGADNEFVQALLQDEGYVLREGAKVQSTIVIDLRPTLDELSRSLHHKWRYNLNKARKQRATMLEGEDENFFLQFERIHREMVKRKRFASFVDVTELKTIQHRLPPALKMRAFLCSVDGDVCAGGVCSALGDTALYLFGATSDFGISTYASYLVHWHMLSWAKSQGCNSYDLNGIDPIRNAGGYQFKRQLSGEHGREVSFIGEYDAYPSRTMKALIAAGDAGRDRIRRSRHLLARFS